LCLGSRATPDGARIKAVILMKLQALLLTPDEKIERVLRRVLGDLEISVDYCADSDCALNKLTRERFEAVIVDCDEDESAARVLKSVRSAARNKRAVAVAIIDNQKRVRGAFELGAHFVLYKPISAERAKASFRAARALMKRERRRNTRIPIEIPVQLSFAGGGGGVNAKTSDLGEGGLAIQGTQRLENGAAMGIKLNLPDSEYRVEARGEIAWVNAGRSAGLRFTEIAPQAQEKIKEWLDKQAPDLEGDDPPVSCRLTDLSLGACYLELGSPFPLRTRVILSLGSKVPELKVEGTVLVAHPEIGMGLEFIRKTVQQQKQVEAFIQALVGGGSVPDLFVQPEGLESGPESGGMDSSAPRDPLTELFREKSDLPLEEFQRELQKQRGVPSQAAEGVHA
jgi:DNA-binding response OmpR family regulator